MIPPFFEPGDPPEIPLPQGWPGLTLQAILHVMALARIVILHAGNWPGDRACDGLRLRVENDRLRAEVNMLQREIAIKDSRLARLDPKNDRMVVIDHYSRRVTGFDVFERQSKLLVKDQSPLTVCANGGFSMIFRQTQAT